MLYVTCNCSVISNSLHYQSLQPIKSIYCLLCNKVSIHGVVQGLCSLRAAVTLIRTLAFKPCQRQSMDNKEAESRTAVKIFSYRFCKNCRDSVPLWSKGVINSHRSPFRNPGGTNAASGTRVCKHPRKMCKDQAQGLSLSAVSMSHRSVISSAGPSAVNQTSGVPVMKQNGEHFVLWYQGRAGLAQWFVILIESSFFRRAVYLISVYIQFCR